MNEVAVGNSAISPGLRVNAHNAVAIVFHSRIVVRNQYTPGSPSTQRNLAAKTGRVSGQLLSTHRTTSAGRVLEDSNGVPDFWKVISNMVCTSNNSSEVKRTPDLLKLTVSPATQFLFPLTR